MAADLYNYWTQSSQICAERAVLFVAERMPKHNESVYRYRTEMKVALVAVVTFFILSQVLNQFGLPDFINYTVGGLVGLSTLFYERPIVRHPLLGNIQKQSIEILLRKKLSDRSFNLKREESLALLFQCIEKGKLEAEKAKSQEIIVVIGNTGSGKSTLVNYLFGCSMVRKSPKQLGLTGLDKLVVVKSKRAGGSNDEIVQIGHAKTSMTFIPHIVGDEQGHFFCDCPGFLDNRGAEINLANIVNIQRVLKSARSAKLVILINYHSLRADKGRGLSDTLKIVTDLFGSYENLFKYRKSLL